MSSTGHTESVLGTTQRTAPIAGGIGRGTRTGRLARRAAGLVAAGALAALLSIPDEPWTDKSEALKYEARFREALDSAFRWNMRGQQRAPQRTSARWF